MEPASGRAFGEPLSDSQAMKRFVFICVSLPCLLLGLTTGCADGRNDERALQEYFETIEAAAAAQRGSLDALGEPEINEDAVLDEQEQTVVRESFATQVRAMETLAAALDELVPPPEVDEAHNDVLTALNGAIAFWTNLLPQLETVETVDDLEEFGTEFVESPDGVAIFERLSSACAELQRVATEHDIDVDLMCA